MKKIFGALMIAVCIGMAMPAQAQIHFGVKGGLNLSKASFSNVGDNFKKDNGSSSNLVVNSLSLYFQVNNYPFLLTFIRKYRH